MRANGAPSRPKLFEICCISDEASFSGGPLSLISVVVPGEGRHWSRARAFGAAGEPLTNAFPRPSSGLRERKGRGVSGGLPPGEV